MSGISKIKEYTMNLYDSSSEIKTLQKKLEDTLSAIDKNNLAYNKGKIPKRMFEKDNRKLRNQGSRLVKDINMVVDESLNFIVMITEEIYNLEKGETNKPKNILKNILKKKKRISGRINRK